MLAGAFAAVLGAYFSGSPYVGALAAMLAGIAMGLVFAEFNLRRGGDPIVVSIAVNILAAGLTTFLLRAIFHVTGAFNDPAIAGFEPIHIPLVGSIPFVGRLLSGQSILFYVAILAVPALHVFFARHRLGLRMRAAGENPAALAGRRRQPGARAALRRWSVAARSAALPARSSRSPTSICSWRI